MLAGHLFGLLTFSLLLSDLRAQVDLGATSQLTCDTNKFIVTIDKETILYGVDNGANFMLFVGSDDGPCTYTGTNNQYIYLNEAETQYVFDVNFGDCGVVRTFHADHLAFDVTLARKEYYPNPDDAPLISRMQNLQLDVSCLLKTSGIVVSTSYEAKVEPVTDDLSGENILPLQAVVYKSDAFQGKYTDYPIYVNEGKLLYVKIEQVGTGVEGIELKAENCTLANTTDLTADNYAGYPMLQDTCVMDAAINMIATAEKDEIRFSMPALRFDGDTDQTYYIVCSLLVCDAYDQNSLCNKPRDCPNPPPKNSLEPATDPSAKKRRQKRETEEASIQQPVFPYKSRERVVVGRIILYDTTADEGGAEDIVNQQVDGDTTTALALGGAAGGSVGVVVTAGTTKLPCG